MATIICGELKKKSLHFVSGVPKVIKKKTPEVSPGVYSSSWFSQQRTTDRSCKSLNLTACGLHVTAAAWFPHVSTSVCTTEEEQVEIMKYRNPWKRGSFRKRACLTEIPRIMEKWQKGKHGKGIVKQPVTETLFFFKSCFHRDARRNLNPLMCRTFPI